MNASRSPDARKSKRPKLDPYIDEEDDSAEEGPQLPPTADVNESSAQPPQKDSASESDTEEHCVICLQVIVDRTVLPACAHDRFCFECLEMWASQSRKCPLCTAAIGPYIIHNIRSQYDFSKYHLPPLRTSPPPPLALSQPSVRRRRAAPQIRWGRSSTNGAEQDEFDRAVERRKWVYRHRLFAKHIASNQYTRFKPYPTPQQFAASQDLISRTTAFIRRELQVWTNMDVEFLTTFILALMKSIDIRSESAVKLLAEFLDIDSPESGRRPNAEHFAHELYTYLRSPYRDLAVYDSVIQYDQPPTVPSPPTRHQRHGRWVAQSQPSSGSSRHYSSREYGRRNEVGHRSRHHAAEQSDEDDVLERSPRDIDSPRYRSPSPPYQQTSPRSQYEYPIRRTQYRRRSRGPGSGEDENHQEPLQRPYHSPERRSYQTGLSRDFRRGSSPAPSYGVRAEQESAASEGRRSGRSLGAVDRGRSRSYESRDQSPAGPRFSGRSRRSSTSSIMSGNRDDLVRSPSPRPLSPSDRSPERSTSAHKEEGPAEMEHNDASIASLSIKGASKSIAASAHTPVLGFSIKGQAARMGLTEMKSLGEDRTRGDQAQESVRDVNLPSLLARMTDSTRPRDGGTDTEAIAPSVADIMARTRHQLSIKHKGKGKAVDSDVNLNVVAEPSLHQPDAISDGEQPSSDADRRRQLMAKLAEERKKFLQSESSRPTNVVSEPNEALEPDETLRDNGLNADEQRLRAQTRLRVKSASERRMVSVPVTQQTPSNSSPMSTALSPVETSLTPVMPTPTSESLLSLEDGLKVKLKQRQTGVSMEQDLKERLRKRKQSLV